MATLPLKSSRYEQRAVIRFFLRAKGLNANEIHSEMRPVYGDKYGLMGQMFERTWAIC